MLNVNDLQSLADRVIGLSKEIAPAVAEIEEAKTLFRDATTQSGEALNFANADGFLKTKKGTSRALRGQKLVFHADAWDDLTKRQQDELFRRGVVTTEDDWSTERKPSVEIGLSTAAKAAIQQKAAA